VGFRGIYTKRSVTPEWADNKFSFHKKFRVTDIKFNSPAYHSGKIEEGDEIVQINYQTVVGWNEKKVIMQLQDSPPGNLKILNLFLTVQPISDSFQMC
jgi:C-terminal processing protease CtpA/Prc